jgi:hypothetical protein
MRLWRFAVALVVLAAAGCAPRRLSSAKAPPGTVLRVDTRQAKLDPGTRILIGGKAATVLRESGAGQAEVLVPLLPPGKAPVLLQQASGSVERAGNLLVERTPSLRLLLRWRGGQVECLAATPFSEPATPERLSGGSSLAYRVLNRKGHLVHTGLTSHPAEARWEIPGDPAVGEPAFRRAGAPSEPVFHITIPNQPDLDRVRFYRREPGASEKTPLHALAPPGQLLNEVAVPPPSYH